MPQISCGISFRGAGGHESADIASRLNHNGVLSPMEYKKSLGMKFSTSFKANPQAVWSANAVLRILKNPVYTGVLIQGKETTPSYKVRKRVTKPENEWAVVSDTHEAIIERRDFDSVQKALSLDTRRSPGDSACSFSAAWCSAASAAQAWYEKLFPPAIKSISTTSAPRTSRINPVRPIGCAMKRWNSWFWTR